MDDYKSTFVRIPEIFSQNNSISCAAENDSLRNGAIVLFFCAVGRIHENLRANNTVWLIKIHVWTADTKFLLGKTSCPACVSSNELGVTFWHTKKSETGKTVILAGKKLLRPDETKMLGPYFESPWNCVLKSISFDLVPKLGVFFWK